MPVGPCIWNALKWVLEKIPFLFFLGGDGFWGEGGGYGFFNEELLSFSTLSAFTPPLSVVI